MWPWASSVLYHENEECSETLSPPPGTYCRVHLFDHLLWPIFQSLILHITLYNFSSSYRLCGRDSGNDFFVSQISDGSGTFPFLLLSFLFFVPKRFQKRKYGDIVTDRQTIRQILWHPIWVGVYFFFQLNLLTPYLLRSQGINITKTHYNFVNFIKQVFASLGFSFTAIFNISKLCVSGGASNFFQFKISKDFLTKASQSIYFNNFPNQNLSYF